jgi:pyrophosphatase PpaX
MSPVTTPAAINDRLRALGAVLFDLDGTLVDTIPHILASFRHATERVFGRPLDDEVLLRHVGVPLAYQMRYFTDDEATAERLLAEYRAFNHATHDEMARIYPNTRSALDTLAATGVPIGVVTSKSAHMARRALDLFGLGGYFAAVVTADDTARHKPDPAPVRHAAEILGVDVRACAYVGDSPADIAAARGAGALAIAATWGVTERTRLIEAGPDLVFDDIAEVADALAAARAPLRRAASVARGDQVQ